MSEDSLVSGQQNIDVLNDEGTVVYPVHQGHYADLAEAPVVATFGKLTALTTDKTQDWDHWRKLRRKFLDGGLEALTDVEILEVFLGISSPKPKRHHDLAVSLISRFGGLAGVVHANPRDLVAFSADSRRATYMAIAVLKCVHVAAVRLLRHDVVDRPIMSSSESVLNYCMARFSYLQHEVFHVLFLNRKNMLILDEAQQRGTVDHVPLYPREVAKRCLEVGASAIVMVHNHPSGDPTPSQPDIGLTRKIIDVLKVFDIQVHDHLIIGCGRHASLRGMGLC
ncbi:MAG: DNA repair protein RadC [Thermoanaerobaculales bacterium]|jgi:DNA repair protein RadC|nr:DNA repair protein RadC [Thermoanaerobaculales bacterium]